MRGESGTGDEGGGSEGLYANFQPPSVPGSATRLRVADLPALVERVSRMPSAFADEFRKLPESSGAECSFAQQPSLKAKNRFKNILPYDDNRVMLSKLNDDELSTYINASFIKGYHGNEKIIASSGPTQATIEDFWRMVWEYDVSVIVMVTMCKEDLKTKCEQYWPEEGCMPLVELSVQSESSQSWLDYVIRKFTITKGSKRRQVSQVQFTAWPDHGVPAHATTLLALRHKVRTLAAAAGPSHYVVVHCSAGVGRTGTYLALDWLLEQAADTNEVDLYELVKSLREQRMNSVQTLEQYTLLPRALLEGLLLGDTTFPTNQISARMCHLTSTNELSGKSVLKTEFDLLTSMQPPYDTRACCDALDATNRDKNRNKLTVPANSQRVPLKSPVAGQTDYINAVFAPGYRTRDSYIVTQLPLEGTRVDFWTMCLDYDCTTILLLTKAASQEQEELGCLLPRPGATLCFEQLSVSSAGPQSKKGLQEPMADLHWILHAATLCRGSTDNASSSQAIYENWHKSKSIEVKVIHVTMPSSRSDWPQAMLGINRTVTSLPHKDPEGPLVVVCRDGVELCGLYTAVSNLAGMLQAEGEGDVVQTVLNIKKAQPHFIQSLEEYRELYSVAEMCIGQTTIYANVL